MSREPCCTVWFSGSDHFPKGPTYYITWLPKGYGPDPDERLICAFPSPVFAGEGEEGLSKGRRPPIIEAIADAIEKFMAEQAEGPTSSKSPQAKE